MARTKKDLTETKKPKRSKKVDQVINQPMTHIDPACDDAERTVIRRTMSMRDYVCLVHFIETGSRDLDLSLYDPVALAQKKRVQMRATASELAKIKQFFGGYVFGCTSTQEILDGIPKVTGSQKVAALTKSKVLTQSTPVVSDNPYPLMQGVENASVSGANGGNKIVDEIAPVPQNSDLYPVLTDEDRALMADEIRYADKNVDELNVDITQYPFIRNWNKPIEPDNFDISMALKMIVQGKVGENEIKAICGVKAAKMLSLKTSSFVGVPPSFSDCDTLAACLIKATDLNGKYEQFMNEPDPDENDVLSRYLDYLTNNLQIKKKAEAENVATFMDKICNIEGNVVKFEMVDEDGSEYDEIRYDDKADMVNDIICFAKKYKLDMNMPIEVFGGNTTLKQLVKEMYDQFPNGLDERSFYKSHKEALQKGALDILKL